MQIHILSAVILVFCNQHIKEHQVKLRFKQYHKARQHNIMLQAWLVSTITEK